LDEPIAIVFYPESPGLIPPIQRWQARNPEWRLPVEDVVTCPVCGLPVLAIADFALLGPEDVRRRLHEFRDRHLRAACSDHYLPTREEWAVIESTTGRRRPR
jgi:hypothetical protein